jgi:hypothetical protein
MMAGKPDIIDILYKSISKNLTDENVKTINTQIGNQKSLPIQEFVKIAKLENVVATVSIPLNDEPSITEIKISNERIYPPTQGDHKRGGGRKSRVSTRRGGGRKSRRRHNYI